MIKKISRYFLFSLASAAVLCVLSSTGEAQRRDYMTEAEIEVVRDSQDIDLRIDTLTKMIDRRFAALGIDVQGWTPP